MHPHGAPQKISLPGVKWIVAVASGKGGVGKSTVAGNLALALRAQNHRVGLLDADIYGPSIPRMMGLPDARIHELMQALKSERAEARRQAVEALARMGHEAQLAFPSLYETVQNEKDESVREAANRALAMVGPQQFPIEKYGIKVMSMGFLVNPEQAVVWRGPMVHKAITDFLSNPNIDWGQLDFMLVDLPPGTGDAQLTLSQNVPLTGALIVTMPQDVSLTVARRGLEMFRQVRVPVLGIVENMSYFIGEDGKRYEIFRHGGGQKLAAAAGAPFMGEIPIDPRVAECGDAGAPIVQRYPDSTVAKAYMELATRLTQEVQKGTQPSPLPGLTL